MIVYAQKYYDRLLTATWQHLVIVSLTLLISLGIAFILTILCQYSRTLSKIFIAAFSMLYSVPSLAIFALMIPLTGLGETTAIIVLVMYNQYLLLRNFLGGLDAVDKSVVEAATGMGMTKLQVFFQVKLPLSRKAFLTGIRIAVVSTVSIATIAACINAGGLGTILFDGLRTMNVAKILWGSILSAALSILLDSILLAVEKRL